MKKLLLLLSVFIAILVLAGCGSDDKEGQQSDGNVSEVDNEQKKDDSNLPIAERYADVFAEADEIADKARIAMMKHDYEGIAEVASPLLLEQMENNEAEIMGIDSNNKGALLPNAEELAGEFYDFGRYDALFDEEEGIVWYVVDTLSYRSIEGMSEVDMGDSMLLSKGKRLEDEPEKILDIMYPYGYSRVFGVKKDDNGIWKVGKFERSLDGVEIDDIDFRKHVLETVNYIHAKPTEEEVKEKYMEKEDSFGF